MPDFTDIGMQGAESRSREATILSSVESPAPAYFCYAPSYPPSQVCIMQLLPSGLSEDPLKSPGVSNLEGITPSSSWSSSHSLYEQASGSMVPYPGVMCMVTSPVAGSAILSNDRSQKEDPYAPCVIFFNQLDTRGKEGVNDLPVINNADFFKTSAINPFLSSSVLRQIEEDGEKTGVIGSDGCWYPLHKNARDTSGFEVVSKEEVAGDICDEAQQEDDEESDVFMRPQSVIIKHSLHRPPLHLPIYNCFHHLNLPEDFLGRPVLLPTRRNKSHLCVFDMLVEYMNLLFRNLPDQWELKVAKRNCKPVTGWSTFKDFAKVRFYCKGCQVGWTSMRGVVMFSYRWNWRLQRGQVLYHILGQKCSTCNPHTFEMPIWYPEEAQKIVTNLYYKICSEVYGLKTPQPIRTRRPGSSRSSHNGSLCQGCLKGVCLVD